MILDNLKEALAVADIYAHLRLGPLLTRSTLVSSHRPVGNAGKLLGDSAAVTAIRDRLLHRGHILKCSCGTGEPSCRQKKTVERPQPKP